MFVLQGLVYFVNTLSLLWSSENKITFESLANLLLQANCRCIYLSQPWIWGNQAVEVLDYHRKQV